MKERMTMRQVIGDFLLRRLQEAGIKHIFAAPGDYNLGLMPRLGCQPCEGVLRQAWVAARR